MQKRRLFPPKDELFASVNFFETAAVAGTPVLRIERGKGKLRGLRGLFTAVIQFDELLYLTA